MSVDVSIIVPIYNKEKYIENTITSVINQSYINWELLLVDDGSTDGSIAICKHYSDMDSRIRLLIKQNGGVSSARNYGLESAYGKYIMFLDADDTLDENAVQILLDNIGDADLVVCSMQCSDGKVLAPVDKKTEFSCIKDSTINAVHLYRNAFYNSPCNKLYKRGLIKNKLDEAICHGEDLLFNLDYFQGCGRIVAIPEVLYYYDTSVSVSLTKRFYSDIDTVREKIFYRMFDVLGNSKEVIECVSYDFMETLVVQTKRLMNSDLTKNDKKRIIKRWSKCRVINDIKLNKAYGKNIKHKMILTLYQLKMTWLIMMICK